jgi:tetratricopeptide (TPR) repeat protein
MRRFKSMTSEQSAIADITHSWLRCIVYVAIALTLPAHAQPDQENHPCGNPFRNHFGPADYRTVKRETRALVENAHFTPGVESMTKPATSMLSNMAGDVAYTLEVFPNHPRALVTMMRLSERDKKDPANGGKYTVECWLDRAVRYVPNDPIPRMLYAEYLNKKGFGELARYQLSIAADNAGDNPFTHNNVGLVYFDLGDYDRALEYAHKSILLGWPKDGLKIKLKAIGKWRDPPENPTSEATDTNSKKNQ